MTGRTWIVQSAKGEWAIPRFRKKVSFWNCDGFVHAETCSSTGIPKSWPEGRVVILNISIPGLDSWSRLEGLVYRDSDELSSFVVGLFGISQLSLKMIQKEYA